MVKKKANVAGRWRTFWKGEGGKDMNQGRIGGESGGELGFSDAGATRCPALTSMIPRLPGEVTNKQTQGCPIEACGSPEHDARHALSQCRTATLFASHQPRLEC